MLFLCNMKMHVLFFSLDGSGEHGNKLVMYISLIEIVINRPHCKPKTYLFKLQAY